MDNDKHIQILNYLFMFILAALVFLNSTVGRELIGR